MKKIILSLSALWLSVSVWGQDPYAPVLEQIEQNSTTLRALQESMKAQKLSNKTGLTPENPEVEFGYLWGSPTGIGNRQDVNVSQSFDFPTVYAHKNKLSDLQNNSVEYEYKSQRMELLLSAKTTCIELVYYNGLHDLYSRLLDNARQIAESYEKMQATGDANRLDYNKAMINYTNMENEIKRIAIERNRLLSELTVLNGGIPVSFDTKEFGTPALPPDFESWYTAAEEGNPALQYLKSQVEVSNKQVQLSRSSNLPKFSIGYAGEFLAEEKFQGVAVGMSIPLWENKNQVKQAKAAAIASQQMEQDAQKEVSKKDVADKLNLSEEKIDTFLNVYTRAISIESGVAMTDNKELTLSEIIEDEKQNVERDVISTELKNDIKKALDVLKEKEKNVIVLRFGLDNHTKKTLEEIGNSYGVTKECIRQIEKKALNKIANLEFAKLNLISYIR